MTRHTVKAPPGAHLSKPLKIAHLTDLHSNGVGRREQKLLAILQQEKPDLIVVTGDSVSRDPNSRSTLEVLRRMKAPLGVYAMRGNWEAWIYKGNDKALFTRAGVKYLVNEAAEVAPRVWLVGIDDAGSGTPNFDSAVREIPSGNFIIAAFHSPAFFQRVGGRAPLVLAGHTHGGQVRIPGLPPLWLPRQSRPYVEGWYEEKGSRMYVSRGIGMSLLPVRFSCRPEVALITVQP